MKHSLELKLKNDLSISPKLQQAIKLLQLSSLELEQELRALVEANPLLEIEENTKEPDSIEVESGDSSPASESNFQDLLTQGAAETTLQNYLLWQMELGNFSEKEKTIASTLIDAISDEGYLTSSLEEIQDSLREVISELSEIESVLNRIQQFEPAGVAARNLSECLSIQLASLAPDTPCLQDAKLLAKEYLELLGKRDYAQLKTALNLNEEGLEAVVKMVTALHPKPGTQISAKRSEYVIPDLIVQKKNDQFLVRLNKEFLPKLRLNREFSNMAAFRTQWKEANWLMRAFKTRNEILLKVGTCIMEAQVDFLRHGEEALQPLVLQDIANRVGLHESSISRITTQKYILTDRGVFELKFFFSSTIQTSTEKETSSRAIRAMIKKWIAEESRKTPLSDQQIVHLLAKRGIKLARRTVAKYREKMSIRTSTERKVLSLPSNPKKEIFYGNPNA